MATKTSRSLIVPKKKMVMIPEADEQDRYCFFCAKHLKPSSFYGNGDPRMRSHLSPMCKSCAKEMAERYEFGEPRGATKDSIKTTLRFLNKPFVLRIYQKAVQRVKDKTNPNESLWGAYIRGLQADKEFKDAPWEFGDELFFSNNPDEQAVAQVELDEDIMTELKVNQKDVVRLIGYDPFFHEPVDEQPLLYSKTVGFLDGAPDVSEDEMKLSSIVEIVKLFNQAEKINAAITDLSKTKAQVADNIATIKALESTKKDVLTTALNLAKDNGISVAHNTNKTKGSNTFAGMSKKLGEMNLREQQANLIDVETASGMATVAELSNRAIMDQIALNETDWPDMIRDQKQIIMKWKKIAAQAAEQARLLAQENADLKRTLELVDPDVYRDNLGEEISTNEGLNAYEVLEEGFIESMAEISEASIEDSLRIKGYTEDSVQRPTVKTVGLSDNRHIATDNPNTE